MTGATGPRGSPGRASRGRLLSLDSLEPGEARAIDGLLFDLDDTFLDHGRLAPDAYRVLHDLAGAGLALGVVTGRPAGWGDPLARQWPVLAVVSENGAIVHARRGEHVELLDPGGGARPERRRRLADLVAQLRARHPELRDADDTPLRLTDHTFDVGERLRAPEALVVAARRTARALGARTTTSSLHLHVTLDGADKATGALWALARLRGLDPAAARARWAYVGDSGNDAAAFAAFALTFGVANLRGDLTLPPRYLARAPRAAGFVEIARALLAARGSRRSLVDDPRPASYAGAPMSNAARLPTADDPQPALLALASEHLYPNYRQPPLVLVRGEGSRVWDAAGRCYLDLCAGIAVSSLGHAHPRLVRALSEQAARLVHTSNYFFNEPNLRLAARLTAASGMDRAFFCNSGTEAIEALLKLARRHFHSRGEPARRVVLAFDESFHGRTLGALAVTGQPKYQEGFGDLPGARHVPYGDEAAVERAMGPDVAAILVEPIQGEGGVRPAPLGFLAALRRIADAHGALLFADEVQTGVGRTGTFLAVQQEGVLADAVALAKGLGGGVPIGAVVCREALAAALPPGTHGSTFGGGPLASAAALAVLDALEEDSLLERVRSLGEHLAQRLAAVAASAPGRVEQARGRGLLQALVLARDVDARGVLERVREAGVLLTIAGGQGLRFSPALTVTRDELDEGVEVVERVLRGLP
ncbi:MAG: acetylornithine/succinylornithine family transaminase [Polyangiaceae bacterium]|nr:acetylornithine/succinylornithine family transaminase [Polyangiaceae bacterium]